MKSLKISAWAILGFIVGSMTLGVIADTTFEWSQPGQKGTLTYTGLGLASPAISGTIADSSTKTLTGIQYLTPTSMNVTNGQTITVSSSHIVFNGIGGAADTTNTIIFPASAAAGQVLYCSVATGSTNLVLVTDSAPVYSSGTPMGPGDGQFFLSVATNKWIQMGGSNN